MTGICPDCGRSWEDVRRGGRLGCPSCWDAFRRELSEVLEGLHGSDRQPEEEDLASQVRNRRRRVLEDALRNALSSEDYTEAGRLRDLLKGQEEST